MRNCLLYIFILSALTSCTEESRYADITEKGPYQDGFFILGEDNSLGNIDYSSNDFTKFKTNVFFSENQENLSSIPEGGLTYGKWLYLISDEGIIKIDRYTLKKDIARTDTEVRNLRDITVYKDHAYLSVANTTAPKILKIDLSTLKTVDSLSLTSVPDKIFAFNNRIYTLIKGDDSQYSNKIIAINTGTFNIEKELNVGFGPNDFAPLGNQILISCHGHKTNGINDEDGSLWVLSTDNTVKEVFNWSAITPNIHEDIQGIGTSYNGLVYYLANAELYGVDGIDPNAFVQASKLSDRQYNRISVFNYKAVAVHKEDYKIDIFQDLELNKSINSKAKPIIAVD